MRDWSPWEQYAPVRFCSMCGVRFGRQGAAAWEWRRTGPGGTRQRWPYCSKCRDEYLKGKAQHTRQPTDEELNAIEQQLQAEERFWSTVFDAPEQMRLPL